MEGLQAAEGGAGGAYTVIRCDLGLGLGLGLDPDPGPGPGRRLRRRRGLPFHLGRLRESYAALAGDPAREGAGGGGAAKSPSEGALARAAEETVRLVDGLLDEIPPQPRPQPQPQPQPQPGSGSGSGSVAVVVVVMVAVLWTAGSGGSDAPVRVRAHASLADLPPASAGVRASVAIAPPWGEGPPLPGRHWDRPGAKRSAWCAERRPLEELFLADGAAEVLLARSASGGGGGRGGGGSETEIETETETETETEIEIELLEGLTSNFFVVYSDGTLRTAPLGSVLGGYARSLVLRAAGVGEGGGGGGGEGRSLVHDPSLPVRLEDAAEGLWDEAFLTSAVRIVVPVLSLVVPEYGSEGDGGADGSGPWRRPTSFREVWAAAAAAEGGGTQTARLHAEALRLAE